MKIELLYPDQCYLYGDLANVRYLHRCCPDAEIVQTLLHDRPAFLDGKTDLVYMGSGTERGLSLTAEALRPHAVELSRCIENGQRFLVTGNALDIFGRSIRSDDGLEIEGLGIFDFRAEYRMLQRDNTFFVGSFGEMTVVGSKSLFGYLEGAPEQEALFVAKRGVGRNPGSRLEGFHRGNFMGTHLLGPLLVLNPPFAKYLLKEMGAGDVTLPFEDTAMAAYEKRVAEMSDEGLDFRFR